MPGSLQRKTASHSFKRRSGDSAVHLGGFGSHHEFSAIPKRHRMSFHSIQKDQVVHRTIDLALSELRDDVTLLKKIILIVENEHRDLNNLLMT